MFRQIITEQNAITAVESQAEETTQGAAHDINKAAQAASIVQVLVKAKNNSAAIVALSPLRRVLHTIFGLTRTQCATVAADGYEDFTDFENMQWDSIEKWISAARNRKPNRGVLSLSAPKEKMIQALEFWVNDSLHIRRVKVESYFDETEFTTINMTEMANEDYIHYLDYKTDSDVSTPDKFSYNKWYIWEETVINWLKTKRGVTNIPLSYDILNNTTPLTMDES